METAYNSPDNRDGNQQNREHISDNDSPNSSRNLENSGPDKSKDFKVLNKDGSLGDLKDQDVPGAGALDGTIGLGT
jgi:hypothetical protein